MVCSEYGGGDEGGERFVRKECSAKCFIPIKVVGLIASDGFSDAIEIISVGG